MGSESRIPARGRVQSGSDLACWRRRAAALAAIAAAAALAACGAPAASVAEGRALYRENGCGSCHGPLGHGDGPVSKTLESRPRDFRDASAFKRGADARSIAQTIAEGLPDDPGDREWPGRRPHSHSQGMPRFDHLSESERASLALYLISLREPAKKGTAWP